MTGDVGDVGKAPSSDAMLTDPPDHVLTATATDAPDNDAQATAVPHDGRRQDPTTGKRRHKVDHGYRAPKMEEQPGDIDRRRGVAGPPATHSATPDTGPNDRLLNYTRVHGLPTDADPETVRLDDRTRTGRRRKP